MVTLAEIKAQMPDKEKALILEGLIADMKREIYKLSVAAQVRAEVGLSDQAEALAKSIHTNLELLGGVTAELRRVTDGQGRQGDPATGGSLTGN